MEFKHTAILRKASSAFQNAFYNSETNELAVQFNNGTFGIYTQFTPADWNNFSNALSQGVYYNQRIKGAYSSSIVDDLRLSWAGSAVKNRFKSADMNVSDEKAPVNITVNIYVNGDDVESAAASLQDLFNKHLKGVSNSSFRL